MRKQGPGGLNGKAAVILTPTTVGSGSFSNQRDGQIADINRNRLSCQKIAALAVRAREYADRWQYTDFGKTLILKERILEFN